MNVALSTRHAVHTAREGSNVPECHTFGAPHGAESYRTTTRATTCRKCLKLAAERADRAQQDAAFTGQPTENEPTTQAEAEALAAKDGRAIVWAVVRYGYTLWAAKDAPGLYTRKGKAVAAQRRYETASPVERKQLSLGWIK